MSLSINKEQVLALLVLAVCVYSYSGWPRGGTRVRPFAPAAEELEIAPVPHAPLVESDPPESGRLDLFTAPRETQPLPPRELPFPPRPQASVVALPLPIGPDARHLVLLACEGDVVEGVTLTTADNSAETAPEGTEPAVAEAQDRAARFAQARKTYASVLLQGQRQPHLGIVEVFDAEGKPVDPFDAEKLTDFSQYTVRLRFYSLEKQKLGHTTEWGPSDLVKVARIELADNLRNEIERRRRKIKKGQFVQRANFIAWLLEKAREESWVYDVALEQADLHSQETGGGLDSLRLRLQVLRDKGDLAREYELLDSLQGPNRESAVRYEGLGRIAARLGLWADAEKNLRHAVELQPQHASPHVALAEYLLSRGRSGEALEAASDAQRTLGSLLQVDEQSRAVRVIVACHLANGDVEGAREARSMVSGNAVSGVIDGAIAYADGKVDVALGAFRKVSGSTGAGVAARGEARLGEAACLIRLGRWQESFDLLTLVYDQSPLLRHIAGAGLSLLHQRIGGFEQALTWADRALEADPSYAYAHYLRGRALRLAGQQGAAEEALSKALELHDDFVQAITDLSSLYALRAESGSEEPAALLAAARRYCDRAVALSPVERTELYELQGIRCFAVGDRKAARAAFERSLRIASDAGGRAFARGALAVVDYSRGRVDDAVDALQRMLDDLPKDDPRRHWAEQTIAAIDEHAQKELLEDRFERSEVGSIWPGERIGSLGATVVEGRLVFRGKFSRAGEVSVERAGAVQHGKNFLAVGVTMQLGPRHKERNVAGLRIMTQQGASGRTDSRIELGVRDGMPYLLVADNRKEPERRILELEGFDPSAPQRLELRVLPRGKDGGRRFLLQVSWNGRVALVRDLESLSGATQSELKTVLFAQGSRGSEVDVAFDDYRLERKKER